MPAKTPITEAKMRSIADSIFEAWNDHDVEALLDHLTDDVVWAEPVLDEPIHGKEAVRAHLKDTFTAFPDLEVLKDGFHVFPDPDEGAGASTWTLRATNLGASKETGLPATGRQITLSGMNLARYRGEQIKEYVLVYDALDMMRQLGALPRSEMGFKALVMADVMGHKAASQAGALVGRARHALNR